ncbi:MAG: MFS transporter [Planctomycetes bacterium]|nr:MFS transporter [Planctomycetota bacterium]
MKDSATNPLGESESESRSPVWVWWICGLLLMASTINYMDRQTLSNMSKRITHEFQLSEEQYGNLELAFGLAFAAGALLFGVIADSVSIRWLYPVVLILWSAMGFATGSIHTYSGLLICRLFLGLFEAGHWPCALKTTQRLLPPERRTLGNSVLQSGTAIGAIITPLIIKWMLVDKAAGLSSTGQAILTTEPGRWRPVFQVIGGIGVFWVILWLLSVRARDFARAPQAKQQRETDRDTSQSGDSEPASAPADSLLQAVFSQKFFVLMIVVVSINACWHLFRVWLPKFLQQGRDYSESAMLDFNFWFNVMTDVGCLSAGAMTAILNHRGLSVHASRTCVFAACSLLVATGMGIPLLPQGPLLLMVLLLVGAGALGLFPCYYSLCQDVTKSHLGKVGGLLGTIAWLTASPLHTLFGRWIDKTKSFDEGLALSCAMPLIALVFLAFFWPRTDAQTSKGA